MMTATRDVAPGDEITFDYCTSNDWPQDWTCACGAPACRGRITGDEWRDPVRHRLRSCARAALTHAACLTAQAIQARYAGHFLPHIAARIAALGAQSAPR